MGDSDGDYSNDADAFETYDEAPNLQSKKSNLRSRLSSTLAAGAAVQDAIQIHSTGARSRNSIQSQSNSQLPRTDSLASNTAAEQVTFPDGAAVPTNDDMPLVDQKEAEISQLNRQVSDLMDRVDERDSTIARLQTEMTQLRQQLEQSKSKTRTLKTENASLKERSTKISADALTSTSALRQQPSTQTAAAAAAATSSSDEDGMTGEVVRRLVGSWQDNFGNV
eukprot:TRINITY_DN2474_c0_g1_i5.p1 TRINITY_DN2474_c0_g1~~TRINITY_DN2474_c0_g1_i5.p1  ORF type:complete len:223 (+),score=41.62 TRINITY_DN2474_c0_g1_i5:171-839(+)